MAVSAGETGSIGIIRDNKVMFYEEPAKKHTLGTEFDVSKESKLPNAQILYFDMKKSHSHRCLCRRNTLLQGLLYSALPSYIIRVP